MEPGRSTAAPRMLGTSPPTPKIRAETVGLLARGEQAPKQEIARHRWTLSAPHKARSRSTLVNQ